MPSHPRIAGIELGGTKCLVLLSEGPQLLVDHRRIATADPATTLAEIEAVLDGWQGAFDAIGIASFGPLSLDRRAADYGSITATPKRGWQGINLLRRFERRYGKPIAIETDVTGAALAESRWGAAQGLASHCYVTIGTGVGVGTIVGGPPLHGVTHGEAGHMRVPRAPGDAFRGGCAFHGDCVEGLLAGPALAKRFGARGEDLPDDGPHWGLFVHDLAGLVHNLIMTLAPERIAIGGGVMASRDYIFPMLRARVGESLGGYGSFDAYAAELDSRLGPPGLGTLAGPLGAIAVGLGAIER